jgi:hypothetical protein
MNLNDVFGISGAGDDQGRNSLSGTCDDLRGYFNHRLIFLWIAPPEPIRLGLREGGGMTGDLHSQS